jgi:RNA polymerase I-specific transcription initiation factor RRN3
MNLTICNILKVKWIHNYIEKNYQNNTSLIFELHRTFYALCQTLFYVIIFRNRQLFNEDISAGPSGHVKSKSIMSLVKTWKLNEIVSCKLNPLRYCLPTVRSKFAKITYVHQIAYCYKIIDANNRVALPVSCNVSSNFKPVSLKASVGGERGMESGGGVNNNPLDSFFPFDPYLLTRSKSIVEKHYVEFRDVIDEEMDDEDDEDSEEEMSDDDEDDDEDEDDDGIDDDETEEEDTDSKLSDFAHHKSQINNKNLFDFDDSDLENSIE